MQAKGPEKPKEEKDEVDESKFDEFMGNDAGETAVCSLVAPAPRLSFKNISTGKFVLC